MNVVDEILAERDCGVVHCGVSAHERKDILLLAKEFQLHDDSRAFEEISTVKALSLVTLILHKDMAYNATIMPEERARELAERFFAQFGVRARYFTNGWPGGWNPATDATFDTGVLVIGDDKSGCIWVEDED